MRALQRSALQRSALQRSALAAGIAAASPWTVRELKRRILSDHERLLFPPLDDETRVLRERLLRNQQGVE